MEPEEALALIDSAADGGLGAPDYSEAYSIVKEALRRVAELEQANFELKRFAEAIAMENDTLRKALKKFTD